MNIRVPKSAKGYKAVAETFGQRYVCTCTMSCMWQQHNCSTCTISCILLLWLDHMIMEHWLLHVLYNYVTVCFRFLGRGLITLLDFDSWRPRRSLYDPTFTKGSVDLLLHVYMHFTQYMYMTMLACMQTLGCIKFICVYIYTYMIILSGINQFLVLQEDIYMLAFFCTFCYKNNL